MSVVSALPGESGNTPTLVTGTDDLRLIYYRYIDGDGSNDTVGLRNSDTSSFATS